MMPKAHAPEGTLAPVMAGGSGDPRGGARQSHGQARTRLGLHVACALVVCVQIVLALSFALRARPDDLGPDGATYLAMSCETEHTGYPFAALGTYYWGALNTIVVSRVLSATGGSLTAVRCVNVIVLALLLASVFRLVRALLGRTHAWVAVATLSLEELVHFVRYVQYELLMMLLLVEGLVLFDRGVRRERTADAVAAGVCLGLACLTQGKVLAVALLVLAWALTLGARAYRQRPTRLLRTVAACGAGMGVVLAFWAARNGSLTGRYSLLNTSGGIYFFLSNNEMATGRLSYPPAGAMAAPPDPAAPERPPGGASGDAAHDLAAARDRAFYRRGLEFIARHPDRFLASVPHKLYWLMEPWRPRNCAILVLALGGAWVVGRRLLTTRCALLAAPVAVTLGIHVFYLGWGRYRFPMLPALHALAAVSLIRLARRLSPGLCGEPAGLETTVAGAG
jgi:hypothetical protein